MANRLSNPLLIIVKLLSNETQKTDSETKGLIWRGSNLIVYLIQIQPLPFLIRGGCVFATVNWYSLRWQKRNFVFFYVCMNSLPIWWLTYTREVSTSRIVRLGNTLFLEGSSRYVDENGYVCVTAKLWLFFQYSNKQRIFLCQLFFPREQPQLGNISAVSDPAQKEKYL